MCSHWTALDICTYLHLSTTIYDPRPWLTSSPSSSATSRGRRRGTRGTWSTSRWSSPSRWWWYDEDVSNDDNVAQEVHSGTMKEMETRFTTLQAGIVNIGITLFGRIIQTFCKQSFESQIHIYDRLTGALKYLVPEALLLGSYSVWPGSVSGIDYFLEATFDIEDYCDVHIFTLPSGKVWGQTRLLYIGPVDSTFVMVDSTIMI